MRAGLRETWKKALPPMSYPSIDVVAGEILPPLLILAANPRDMARVPADGKLTHVDIQLGFPFLPGSG
jgi:hypothetical protein